MNEPSHDHPVAVMTVFRGAPQWWLARGCPPTVRRLHGWARALHVTVLIDAAGLVAATLLVCVLPAAQPGSPWDSVAVGIIFGTGVVLPVSRWLGRAWWSSTLSMPFLILWFACVDLFNQRWLFRSFSATWTQALAMVAAMFLIAIGPGLWVIRWNRPGRLQAPAGIAVSCILATGAEFLHRQGMYDRWIPTGTLAPAVDLLLNAQPLLLFLTGIAAALGIPLWSDDAAQPETPCPAANTAATGTENPSSSTDVAVSPDLNSP